MLGDKLREMLAGLQELSGQHIQHISEPVWGIRKKTERGIQGNRNCGYKPNKPNATTSTQSDMSLLLSSYTFPFSWHLFAHVLHNDLGHGRLSLFFMQEIKRVHLSCVFMCAINFRTFHKISKKFESLSYSVYQKNIYLHIYSMIYIYTYTITSGYTFPQVNIWV